MQTHFIYSQEKISKGYILEYKLIAKKKKKTPTCIYFMLVVLPIYTGGIKLRKAITFSNNKGEYN